MSLMQHMQRSCCGLATATYEVQALRLPLLSFNQESGGGLPTSDLQSTSDAELRDHHLPCPGLLLYSNHAIHPPETLLISPPAGPLRTNAEIGRASLVRKKLTY